MDNNIRNVPTNWEDGGIIYGLNNQQRCVKCGVRNLEPGKPVICPDCILKTRRINNGV